MELTMTLQHKGLTGQWLWTDEHCRWYIEEKDGTFTLIWSDSPADFNLSDSTKCIK